MTTRKQTYMERYARTLGAAYRVQRIEQDVQAEQDKIQYFDSLIANEQQLLAALSDRFRVEEVDYATAQALIEQVSEADKALAAQLDRKVARVAEALSMPKEMTLEGLGNEDWKRLAMQELTSAIANDKTMTKARYDAILAEGKRRGTGVGLKPNELGQIKFASAPGLTQAEREQREELQKATTKALEAAYFAGPSGIRGGYEGMDIAKRRKDPSLLDEAARTELSESGFITQEKALQAALAVVRETGDPSMIASAVAASKDGNEAAGMLAARMYEEAREKKAYRNDMRMGFEQEALDVIKRRASLQEQRDQLAGAYDDPRQEILRRELRARGYTVVDPYNRDPNTGEWKKAADSWKNSYIRYQNTPEYDYYIGAHQFKLDAEANPEKWQVTPDDADFKAQNPGKAKARSLAVSYTMMRDRKGMNTEPAELAAQLKKAGVKGDDLKDAVSYTMAWWALGGPDTDPELIKHKAEERKRLEQADKAKKDAAAEAQRKIAEEDERIARFSREAERSAQADVEYAYHTGADAETQEDFFASRLGKEVAAGETAAATVDPQKVYIEEYKRHRAMGLDEGVSIKAARQMALDFQQRQADFAAEVEKAPPAPPAPAPAPDPHESLSAGGGQAPAVIDSPEPAPETVEYELVDGKLRPVSR